ncbi:hypothetical protein J6590_063418 [Homalodisca vitripennis]|nr:hypothetical protein J6590_063418 [Homalodisca vitripennis]
MDNLKEAEEKRWTADEKYLKALGFTTSPRLYPAAVWTNTSLPIVVSYLLDGDAELGVGLARNIAHHLPNNTLLLYNLGLGRYDLQLRVPMAERSKSLDFGSELEIAQVQILSVTVALFISTINLVLYRLSPLFCLIRSSHRPVVHERTE